MQESNKKQKSIDSLKSHFYLTVTFDLIVHCVRPDSIGHVCVAKSLCRPGTVILEVIVGHHGILGVTAGLQVRNTNSYNTFSIIK